MISRELEIKWLLIITALIVLAATVIFVFMDYPHLIANRL